jgi:hypothetical protein
VLRWRASDADRDALTMSADYSADGGRHWKTIFLGRDRGHVKLPTRLLTGSRNARLRVRANDGFVETARTSRRFTSDGARPVVTIATPARGMRLRADATLVAAGSAYDDGGRALRGRRLTWRLGRRVVGHGADLGAIDLPPGRRQLRLTARDRRGRTGSASVPVRIVGVAPRFVVLRAPRSVRRGAHAVRLRVATNVAATLRIGRSRLHVTRRARTIRVPVRAGARALRLRGVLRAGGRRRSAVVVVMRRA